MCSEQLSISGEYSSTMDIYAICSPVVEAFFRDRAEPRLLDLETEPSRDFTSFKPSRAEPRLFDLETEPSRAETFWNV